jgi:hypothetical protein
MMRADHSVHGEIAEPQPSPGFLLAPFGWAAELVAAMMRMRTGACSPTYLPSTGRECI